MKYLLYLLIFLPFSCSSPASENSMQSLLVCQNGQLVSEEYFNGFDKQDYANVQSLTKGLASILIGIAIDQAVIKSEDQAIDSFFADEFKSITDTDKRKITIKHLLNQTSGLQWDGYLEHENWLKHPDPISDVLSRKLEHQPGTRHNYNSGATHLLSAILTKASGKSTLDFAQEYLFDKLNIESVKWEKRNNGYYDCAGFGLSMRPAALVKIGLLLEGMGTYEGTKVVSENWVAKLLDESEKSNTKWGIRKSTHGYCWYKSKINGDEVNYGMGYGGQFIFMIPAKQLVIVTTHNHDTPGGLDQQIDFLSENLPDLLETYN